MTATFIDVKFTGYYLMFMAIVKQKLKVEKVAYATDKEFREALESSRKKNEKLLKALAKL